MKSNLHQQTNSSYYRLSLVAAMAMWDGYIDAQGRLAIQHSAKQAEYLDWKAKLLSDAFGRTVNVSNYTDKNGFSNCRICFTDETTKRLREMLYPDGKKAISEGALNLLKTHHALTIMYLDDGSLTLHKDAATGKIKSREVYLATNSFQPSEVAMFCEWLERNYGVIGKAAPERNNYRVRLNASNALRLFELLADIPKCMAYKIDMKYAAPMPNTAQAVKIEPELA